MGQCACAENSRRGKDVSLLLMDVSRSSRMSCRPGAVSAGYRSVKVGRCYGSGKLRLRMMSGGELDAMGGDGASGQSVLLKVLLLQPNLGGQSGRVGFCGA